MIEVSDEGEEHQEERFLKRRRRDIRI